MKAPIAFALSALLAGLAGCTPKVVAPTDRGVCFMVVPNGDKYRFDRLASAVPDLEHCAAEMEKTRTGLNRLGATTGDMIGSYQGRFLFRTDYGYSTSTSFDGNRYPFMVPYNGKLVVPGAVPQ
ncbi:MAG: hypothetical protein WCI21_05520 [Alphaproteobacteria bacterium]